MQKRAFDQVQHLFMIKTLKKLGIEGKYLNIIKAVNDKLSTTITLNSEKLKSYTLR